MPGAEQALLVPGENNAEARPFQRGVLVLSDTPVDELLASLRGFGWNPRQLTSLAATGGQADGWPAAAAIALVPHAFAPILAGMRALQETQPTIPQLVVTDDPAAVEQSLLAGAVASLPASVPPTLLHAQLSTLLRWRGTVPAATEAWHVRGLRLHPDRKEILLHGRPLTLTPTEYRLLATLIRFAGRTLAADFLLQQSAGLAVGEHAARAVVKVHIARLRQKLAVGGEPSSIVTVRLRGYRLERQRRRSSST